MSIKVKVLGVERIKLLESAELVVLLNPSTTPTNYIIITGITAMSRGPKLVLKYPHGMQILVVAQHSSSRRCQP